MGLRASINLPRVDVARSIDALDRYMAEFSIIACRTWVIAIGDYVPVWTGGTKASFWKAAFLAGVGLSIDPVHFPDRIDLGIAESSTELIREKGKKYGFEWGSDLFYIHIVDARVDFLGVGIASLRPLIPELPPPVYQS